MCKKHGGHIWVLLHVGGLSDLAVSAGKKTRTTLLGEKAHGRSRRSEVRGTTEIQEVVVVVVLVGLCIARRRGIEAWAVGGRQADREGGRQTGKEGGRETGREGRRAASCFVPSCS